MRTLVCIVVALLVATLAGGCAADPGAASAPPPEDAFTRPQRMIDEAKMLSLPEGNYRIEVERVWLSESDTSSVGAIFGYRDNSVAVRVGQPAVEPGFRISVGGSDFRASLDATLRRSQRSERTRASIVTIADSPAFIDVGEVRYGVPIDLGPRRGTLIVPQGQFAGTSLEAVVAPAGPGQVTLRLTPLFSQHGPGGTTRVTEMSTTVRVPLDRPVVIGRHDRTGDSVASGLLSRTTARGREQAVVILTVTAGTG